MTEFAPPEFTALPWSASFLLFCSQALSWEAPWETPSPYGRKLKVSDQPLRSKKALEREGDEKKEELELLCCLTDRGGIRRVAESQEITLRENYLLKNGLKTSVIGNQTGISWQNWHCNPSLRGNFQAVFVCQTKASSKISSIWLFWGEVTWNSKNLVNLQA